jgi:GPH family glycoside/pentoside/hexuronide:cation symporter
MVRGLALHAFMASHCGKSLLWVAGDAFALYIMVVLLKLPPVTAGTLFLAGSLWNAALDAAWGAALARFGRLRRWTPQIGGGAVLIACLSFAALPLAASGSLASAAILLILFRTAFALFDVPHNALSAILAARHGHLRFMRLRTVGSSAAGIVVAAAAIPLLAAKGTVVPVAAMMTIGAAALLLLVPLPWLLAIPLQAPADPSPAVTSPQERGRLMPVLTFCLVHMAGIGALAAVGKAALHLDAAHAWIVTTVPLLLAVTRLGSIPLWSGLAQRLGITGGLVLAYGASAVAIAVLPAGLASGMVGTALVFALLGTGLGGVVLLIWSAFSQLLERVCATMPGMAASRYGIFTASTKIGLGGSAYLAGHWLARGVDEAGSSLSGLATLLALTALLCAACEWWRAHACGGSSAILGEPLERTTAIYVGRP